MVNESELARRIISRGNAMRVLILCFAVVFWISCMDSLNKMPVDSISEPGKDIDAKSSASQKLQLKGGIIKSSEVSLDIWYLYDNGNTWIRFGQAIANPTSPTESTIKYGYPESLNQSPNFFLKETINRYTKKNLIPDKEYFFWIYGENNGNTWEIKDSFTTK